jgi:hypothetical protein
MELDGDDRLEIRKKVKKKKKERIAARQPL